MSAYVRVAKTGKGAIPRWQGGACRCRRNSGAQVERLFPSRSAPGRKCCTCGTLLHTQSQMSALPAQGELLVEWTQFDEKWFLTVYPFAGRAVNEGMAALVTLRWSRVITTTFAYAANDYGFIVALPRQTLMDDVLLRELLSPQKLIEDLLACVNVGELSRRQFREIARIAGLLPPSLPGRKPRSLRHLQASAGLIYDVLQRFDPGHLLLSQAQREVFEAQLDVREMSEVLARCANVIFVWRIPIIYRRWRFRYGPNAIAANGRTKTGRHASRAHPSIWTLSIERCRRRRDRRRARIAVRRSRAVLATRIGVAHR